MGGGGEKKRNADEEEKGRVLKTVLHLFKVYVFLFQKFFNHFIPRMLQCFIHGKCLERCPGNTGQAGAVKMDVQVEPCTLSGSSAGALCVIRRPIFLRDRLKMNRKLKGVRFPLITEKQKSRRFFQGEYSGSSAPVSKNSFRINPSILNVLYVTISPR